MSDAAPDARFEDTNFEGTRFEYVLDEHQRTMLDAMGIKTWLPAPQADAGIAPIVSEPNRQLAGVLSAQSAIEIRANKAQVIAAQPVLPAASPRTFAPAPSPATSTVAAKPLISTPSISKLPEGIAQMDWPALQTAVSGCQACGLCASRKNTVFGVGPTPLDPVQAPQVDWLIVGEAPGENEDAQGEPFVGQSGKLLDNMLAAMRVGKPADDSGDAPKPTGLSRQRGVYIANVIKCRPPENRNPTAEEMATCSPYLARQIELLRPKIILAMGKFAISAVTGSNAPVGQLRGRVHPLAHASYQAPVIVTYHPAYLLRNLPEKAKAWADLVLAMQTYTELKT